MAVSHMRLIAQLKRLSQDTWTVANELWGMLFLLGALIVAVGAWLFPRGQPVGPLGLGAYCLGSVITMIGYRIEGKRIQRRRLAREAANLPVFRLEMGDHPSDDELYVTRLAVREGVQPGQVAAALELTAQSLRRQQALADARAKASAAHMN